MTPTSLADCPPPPAASAPAFRDAVLDLRGRPALRLPEAWPIAAARDWGFAILDAPSDPACHAEVPLGRILRLKRFVSGARTSPFWLKPATGRTEAEVRPETLWLLAEREDGLYLLLAPLLNRSTRFSLRGGADGLTLVAETGDPGESVRGEAAVAIALGDDPYALTAAAAAALSAHFGGGVGRSEKPVPPFVDRFGWCTWDAFYKEVSMAGILEGLRAFAAGGVRPGFLLIDDGWQTVNVAATGEERLGGFEANPRFPGGLAATVRAAKTGFGVAQVLVWHALFGYWGGVDDRALPGYETREVARAFGPGILAADPYWNVRPWGARVAVPAGSRVGRFFADYHRRLREQGVDGVKVDTQALLEAVSQGQGGRVQLARAYRDGLERSVREHFAGNLINCMACTTECAYLAPSLVMRTSDDYWPQRPESHGEHLYTNAQAGVWFGEFMLPDWDMFQSGGAAASFHAAARAICGGPVYVSDQPGTHDFELLRKLVLWDGALLRSDQPARPTLDCLFTDPTAEPVILKIFTLHRDAGVVGLFNARFGKADASAPQLAAGTGPDDVYGLRPGAYAAYAHRSGSLRKMTWGEREEVRLAEWEWELVSFAPVQHGFAPIGLRDKFNSTAAIAQLVWVDANECRIDLRDGGAFLAWTDRPPSEAWQGARRLEPRFAAAEGRWEIELASGGPVRLTLRWS